MNVIDSLAFYGQKNTENPLTDVSSSGELGAMKPKVILTRKLPDSVETRMRELFDAELSADDVQLSSKHLSN